MVEHTLNWYKGEIFEAKFILAFGIATIVVASLYRYFGSTPNAKALFIPMLLRWINIYGHWWLNGLFKSKNNGNG